MLRVAPALVPFEDVVEPVDTLGLKLKGFGRAGSTPAVAATGSGVAQR